MNQQLRNGCERMEGLKSRARALALRRGLPAIIGDEAVARMIYYRGFNPCLPCYSCPDYSRCALMQNDGRLNPGWDREAFPYNPPVEFYLETCAVVEDGKLKVVTRGFTADLLPLEQLNSPDLSKAFREFLETADALAQAEEEQLALQEQTPKLRQRLERAPLIISHQIRRAFPDGTAQQPVDIIPIGDPTQDCYALVVNRVTTPTAVNREFGQGIMAKKNAMKQAEADYRAKIARLAELTKQIADLETDLPVLRDQTRELFDNLNIAALETELRVEILGLTLDDNGQPVVWVRRPVDKTLNQLTPEMKRAFVAQHLGGREFPVDVQETLGIREIIAAAESAMAKTPPIENKPVAPPQLTNDAAATSVSEPGVPTSAPETWAGRHP